MAESYNDIYINQYNANMLKLAQQEQSKLMNTINIKASHAQIELFDRYGVIEASQKTATRQSTTFNDVPFSRRQCTANPYKISTSIAESDINQMLVDPQGSILNSFASGFGRVYDDIIISAIVGSAIEEDRSGTVITNSSVALASPQLIDNTGSILSYEMITDVIQVFQENEIDHLNKFAVVSPAQVNALLNDDKAISADYVKREALQTLNATGIVANFMGFTWIVSNRLPVPTAGTAQVLFYDKDAIQGMQNYSIETNIAKDPSMNFETVIYSEMMFGAVRMEEKRVIALTVSNSVTV